MVIAKTSTSASENHSAQRIVTSPLHFPSQPVARPGHGRETQGRRPADQYPSLVGDIARAQVYRFNAGMMSTTVRCLSDLTRLTKHDQLRVDWVASVTIGTMSSRPLSARILAERLRGASWSCNEVLCFAAFWIASMSSAMPALLR
jgi:hypothetical protein